jgi:hypothetical protein
MIALAVILSGAKNLRDVRHAQGDRLAIKLGGTAKLFAPMAESFFLSQIHGGDT